MGKVGLGALVGLVAAVLIACGGTGGGEETDQAPVTASESTSESTPQQYSVDVKLGPSCTWVAASPPHRCFDSKFCPGGGNELCLTTGSDSSCSPHCKCACDK